MTNEIPSFKRFNCYYCHADQFMYDPTLVLSWKDDQTTCIYRICPPCVHKHNLQSLLKTQNEGINKDLEESIAISQEDYEKLKFFRNNAFCKLLYRIFK